MFMLKKKVKKNREYQKKSYYSRKATGWKRLWIPPELLDRIKEILRGNSDEDR